MATELFVQYTQHCISSHRDPEPFGDWREEYDFSVNGVSLTSRSRYCDETITVGVEIKAGEPVFVLYMTYSSGDSFGRAYGKGEVLWVFKDPALAMKAKKQWENDAEEESKYSVEFEVDGGQTIKLSNPASGYFENVGHIDVSTFLVNP